MNRDDIVVLMQGIHAYCENCWMFVGSDEEDIEQAKKEIWDFDKNPAVIYGWIEWLKDWRDDLIDIKWSVDTVLNYLLEHFPNYQKDFADAIDRDSA